ncbi:GNAT family N-acetyltransferase [Ruegeria profundi]|uniref:BioF2-like acetyltransferase domain-containing protein n=1 Tax=Ruegeria profundi TaxID=1685378 RepID=A0A0X3TWP3_9RHOB|nr:GNAT family N-acetyltransferase [Ruegeria profundi]KUJ80084.1 hypothetical protein AVO44_07930 [Ruegeria profundi]
MKVELIKNWQAIVNLKTQWHSVYKSDPEACYFLSHEWLFGTKESIGRGGFVIGVREADESSDFVAFLPVRLYTKNDKNGFYNEVDLIGAGVSDYHGFICNPEYEEKAIVAFADMLNRMNWRRFRLRYTPTSKRRLQIFLNAFSGEVLELKSLGMHDENGINLGICPYTLLPDDWDEYLAKNVSSNTRHKIRRYLRQVEGSESFYFTHTTAETLERDIKILNRLWTERWGESKGDELPNIQHTTRRILRSAFFTDTLFFPILWQNDNPLCALGIFVDHEKKTYNFHIGGRDTSFKGPLSPGLVTHAYAIRHAISQGMQQYDFLRGNEPYKYSFCSEERHLRSLIIVTKSGRNMGDKLERGCLRYVWKNTLRLYREGDLAAAKRGCSQILKSDSNQPNVLYFYGYTLAQLGDHDIASRAFLKALQRNPESPKLWLRLGRSMIARQAQSREAARHGNGGLDSLYDASTLLRHIARILSKLNLADQAVAVSEAAVKLDPEDTDLTAALAKALSGRKSRAVSKRPDKQSNKKRLLNRRLGKNTQPSVINPVRHRGSQGSPRL